MTRTTIMLPETLKQRAIRQAQSVGISLGELIREALKTELERNSPDAGSDMFLADDDCFMGDVGGITKWSHYRHKRWPRQDLMLRYGEKAWA